MKLDEHGLERLCIVAATILPSSFEILYALMGYGVMVNNKFDLNVEEVLSDWKIYHAVREVIANGLDEAIITKTKDIEILKDEEGNWHIKDFGRGLSYKHLTQNENKEKLVHKDLIGKFGVGLKDALAVFDRHGISVLIKSKYGTMSLVREEKVGFKDLITLHVKIDAPVDNFVGTEFILSGITEDDIKNAKNLFLKFSKAKRLEITKYGEVIEKEGKSGNVYINGVKVAEENNFLFSYNITLIDNKIKKALNRERTNVGRTAYADRIKLILIECKDSSVVEALMEDFKEYNSGEMHDELQWIDVQEHTIRILNANSEGKIVFLSPEEILNETKMVDEAKGAGYTVMNIPQNLRNISRDLVDIKGDPIKDLSEFYKEYNDSFEFKFVDIKNLNKNEFNVFNYTDKIFALIGGKPEVVKGVKISETMRTTMSSITDASGLWDGSFIIIKRSALRELKYYAGILLHEVAHASSGAEDVNRDFELKLSEFLGIISVKALNMKVI